MSFIEQDPSLDEPYAEYEAVAEELEELSYPSFRRRKNTERSKIERRLRRNKHRLLGGSALMKTVEKTLTKSMSSDMEELTMEEFPTDPIAKEGILRFGENIEPIEEIHELSRSRLLDIIQTAAEEQNQNYI